MSGNVWEWVGDRYGAYSPGSITDPTGASAGSYRVYRGGGWGADASLASVAFRGDGFPGRTDLILGFRLSRSSP